MAISNKERILVLRDIFELYTDEEKELSYEDIRDIYSRDYSTNVGIKAVKDDVATLIYYGYDLVENTGNKGKKYFSRQDRPFEMHELLLLIDAVHSARFISEKEKKAMIEKIRESTSLNMRKYLHNITYIDDKEKSYLPELRYNIDKLQKASCNSKAVSFDYGKYNINKEFIVDENREKSTIYPINLVWNHGFYYLIGYNVRKERIVNYRVDRMRNVEVLNEGFNKSKVIKNMGSLRDYMQSCFNMYPGDVRYVEIKIHKSLLNSIIDRFGLGVEIEDYDENYFILKERVAITDGFVRWILNWGKDAEVLYPESLRERMKEELEGLCKLYR